MLTDDLTRLTTWLGLNGLTMNVHKTQFMSLSRKCQEKEANGLRVLVEKEALEKCDDAKYLGVIVDRQLNWSKHVDRVKRKCLSRTGSCL